MSTDLPGDAAIFIGGKRKRLRLTLGALAHMEEHIGGGDTARLFERLKNPGAGDLLHLLHALLIGGGEKMALDVLTESDVDIEEAGRAIAKALRALAETRDGAEPSPGKQRPRRKLCHGRDGFATR